MKVSNSSRVVIASVVASCGLSAGARAQTVWSGAVGTDWLNAGNWVPGVVPGLSANRNAWVVIDPPAAVTVQAVESPDILYLSQLRVPRTFVTTRFAGTDVEINDVFQHSGRMVVEAGSFRSRIRYHGIELGGGGEIFLDSGPGRPQGAFLTFSNYPTIASGTTIRGRGWLVGAFTNSAVINADQAGDVINVDPNQGESYFLRNHGLMEATQGGRLAIGTFEIDGAGGVFSADGGTVEFRGGADLLAGTLSSRNGGRILLNGSVFESGVRYAGEVFVGGGSLLRFNFDNLNPTVRNSGVLHAINESGGDNPAVFNVRYSTTFTGGGVLSMDARTGLWNEARFLDNGFQTVVTNAAGHTFRGIGTFETTVSNHGRLRVGYPGEAPSNDQASVLRFTRALTLESDGTLEVPIAAGGAAGWIVADAPQALGGALRVVVEGGPLNARVGDSWDFIQAPAFSGSFASMDLPGLGAGLRWRGSIVDGGDKVFRLSVSCGADFNGDGFVDFFDYDDFVLCFESGRCPAGSSADYNGDGFADFFDYDDFVAAFEGGC